MYRVFVPSMVSCFGFGLPMHAQLLRLLTVEACTGRPHIERIHDEECVAEIFYYKDTQ